MGIATIGVKTWPMGITEPKYPAALPWLSGV